MSNLHGKAFTFPGIPDSYVRLHPTVTLSGDIAAASVCLRYFSDMPEAERVQSFFSLATRKRFNGFLLSKKGNSSYYQIVGDAVGQFWGLPADLNHWNSVCGTWDSDTGLSQVWVNGKPGARKFVFKGGRLTGTPIVIIGLDQDAYGGGFYQIDAFIGQLTDVHMWDRVIAPCEINNYSEDRKFQHGNLINWHAAAYTTYGNVVEEKQIHSDLVKECRRTDDCCNLF
ncbi:C-reactive protein-like [Engraulis encrasicolus]|uniref:C-reactive protein-like n=1 Tax=Engraulis encrasicolus TaxID=184585 RepID=UPI002FD302E3